MKPKKNELEQAAREVLRVLDFKGLSPKELQVVNRLAEILARLDK